MDHAAVVRAAMMWCAELLEAALEGLVTRRRGRSFWRTLRVCGTARRWSL